MKKNKIVTLFLFFSTNLISSQISFEDKAIELGVNLPCGNTYLGNGVTFYDFDNDGWDDISFATGIGEPLLFFKNDHGVFQGYNFPSIDNYKQTKQINWVDFDNDGDKDLFVTSNISGNTLYENNGDFVFTDITIPSGLPQTNKYTYGSSWGDYNNDGFLDLFICNRDEITFSTPNYLFKNNGDGTFTDVSNLAGINTTNDLSFCAAFFDFNNDGYQDIYVSNDKPANLNVLYKNNGDETFTDVSISSGTNVGIDAMSVTIADINNDNWFDIYITNTFGGNVLFKNNGDETFTNIAVTSGTTFNSIGWGAVFFDAENDKDLDLYVSGSLDGSVPNYKSAAFYKNIGNNVFEIPQNAGFINDNRESHSNAIGDFNNDGYNDIVVNNNDDELPFLWKNESTQTNNWLKVKLQGTVSNKDGIGSVIEISVNGDKQYKYTLCGEGYLSQNSATQIFGLQENEIVNYVKVKWLSGIEDIYYNIIANQTLKLTEGQSTLSNADYNSFSINIFPNPVENTLHLDNKEFLESVTITNNLGLVILELKNINPRVKINLSMLSSGLYYIKICNSTLQYSLYKFLKK